MNICGANTTGNSLEINNVGDLLWAGKAELIKKPSVWEHKTNAVAGDVVLKYNEWITLGKLGKLPITEYIALDFKVKEDAKTYYNFQIVITAKNEEEGREPSSFTDVLTNIDKYIPNSSNSSGVSKAEEKIGKILGVITNIGIIVSVIMVAVLGVKYMIGSVEEKAEYKHDMIPYLVGNILLFGICTIVKILQAVGNSFIYNGPGIS